MICLTLGVGNIPSLYAAQDINVGIYNFRPLAFLDKHGEATGLFVDILNEIARQEDWKITYIPGTWNESVRRLNNSEIDLLINVAHSAEREGRWNFTDTYLILDWATVFTQPGSPIENIFDLDGKTVSVLKNAITTIEFIQLLEAFGLTCALLEKENNTETLQAVHDGEADAGVCPNIYGTLLEANYHIERSTIVFAPIKLRFAALKNRQRALLATLDQHITDLKADSHSIYYRLRDKWLGGPQETGNIPAWLLWGTGTILGAFVISLGFSLMLRARVAQKTAELIRLNQQLLDSQSRLQESEAHFRAYFELGLIGMVMAGADKHFIAFNDYLCKMWGYSREELAEKNWVELTHPDDLDADMAQFQQVLAGEINGYMMDKRFLRKDGGVMYASMAVNCVRRADGSVDHFITMIQDITERKQVEEQIQAALKEKEVLLREIHHRVKNNLMVVTSLIQMQSEETHDQEALNLFRDLYHRVMAMSMVHEDLYQSRNLAQIEFSAYLQRLVQNIQQGFSNTAARVNMTADKIFLSVQQAIPCGMIVAELVTNAFKYAFPLSWSPSTRQAGGAEICVEMHCEGSTYTLLVHDNGVGLPPEFDLRRSETLGMELLRSWVMHQLKGQITVEHPPGTTFRITFPGDEA